MTCNTILLVSRLIWKRFRLKFIDIFEDVCSLRTCFSADSFHLAMRKFRTFFSGHPVYAINNNKQYYIFKHAYLKQCSPFKTNPSWVGSLSIGFLYFNLLLLFCTRKQTKHSDGCNFYLYHKLPLTKCIYQAFISKTHYMITTTCNLYNKTPCHNLCRFFQLATTRQNTNWPTGILSTTILCQYQKTHISYS